MTRDKDRKRIIRNRMTKTGESYTAARAQVISKASPKPSAARSVEPAVVPGVSDEKIAAKTGYGWREWVRMLDADGAAKMKHRDIAELIASKYGVEMWWTQTVTVGYERIKGLREVGQRRSGEYEVSRTKTFNVPVSVLFDAWANDTIRRQWLDAVDAKVRKATKPKSVRLQWPDGPIIVVGFTAKGSAKSTVAVTHPKLPDRAAMEKAKKYWTGRLQALSSVLAAAAN
jgi:uncharacterized protein YndB with AHSA1/START domain